METKLIAAEIATAAGVTTVITSSKRPDNICNIIEYHRQTTSKNRSDSVTPNEQESSTVPSRPSLSPSRMTRPPHTVFTASSTPMRDLKTWTSHTLSPSGSVIIDAGAHQVLSRRESGGRLLAAGVLGVIGAFASGQAVRIAVKKRADGTSSEEADAAAEASYAKALETRPNTPTLGHGTISSLGEVPNDDIVLMEKGKEEITEADVVEVGRGLANYNSAQITRIKGLNRYGQCLFHLINKTEIWQALVSHSCWDMQIRNMLLKISRSAFALRVVAVLLFSLSKQRF